MKAEYILKAMEAMQAAEALLNNPRPDGGQAGTVMAKLFCARIGLRSASGLNDAEVSIEKEAA